MSGRMSATRWRGPWADSCRGAIGAALTEAGVDPGDWIECEHAESAVFVPVDPEVGTEIQVEPTYSESRDQWRVDLIRVPSLRRLQ